MNFGRDKKYVRRNKIIDKMITKKKAKNKKRETKRAHCTLSFYVANKVKSYKILFLDLLYFQHNS